MQLAEEEDEAGEERPVEAGWRVEAVEAEEQEVAEVGPVEHLKISSPSYHWQGTQHNHN